MLSCIKHFAALCRCRNGRFGAMSGKMQMSPPPCFMSYFILFTRIARLISNTPSHCSLSSNYCSKTRLFASFIANESIMILISIVCLNTPLGYLNCANCNPIRTPSTGGHIVHIAPLKLGALVPHSPLRGL